MPPKNPPDKPEAPAAPELDPLKELQERCAAAEAPAAGGDAGAGQGPSLCDPAEGTGATGEAAVGAILSFCFSYVAARKGEHWILTSEEKQELVPLAARVAAKWAPVLLKKYADECALLFLLVGLFSKRMEIDARKAPEASAPAVPAGAGA